MSARRRPGVNAVAWFYAQPGFHHVPAPAPLLTLPEAHEAVRAGRMSSRAAAYNMADRSTLGLCFSCPRKFDGDEDPQQRCTVCRADEAGQ